MNLPKLKLMLRISSIDSMYKEMEYKTYKENLFKGIRLDVMNLTEILSKNSNQNMVTNPTDIFPFQQDISPFQCKEK